MRAFDYYNPIIKKSMRIRAKNFKEASKKADKLYKKSKLVNS